MLVLLAVAVGPAFGGTRAAHVNGTDMAAARAAVLRRSDLPAGDGWKGGPVKKALLAKAQQVVTVECSGSSSDRSSLVPTGAAYSMFTNMVLFRHGRTQVELDTVVPYAERTIIVAAEIHLARALASRLSV